MRQARTWRALAAVGADTVDAGTAVVAEVVGGGAVVVVRLTPFAGRAVRTDAPEVVDQVQALAAVQARLGLALVHVKLAVRALQTRAWHQDEIVLMLRRGEVHYGSKHLRQFL